MEQKKEYFTARQIDLANLANRPDDALPYLSPVRGNPKSPSVTATTPSFFALGSDLQDG